MSLGCGRVASFGETLYCHSSWKLFGQPAKCATGNFQYSQPLHVVEVRVKRQLPKLLDFAKLHFYFFSLERR